MSAVVQPSVWPIRAKTGLGGRAKGDVYTEEKEEDFDEEDPNYYPDAATVAAMKRFIADARPRWPSTLFVVGSLCAQPDGSSAHQQKVACGEDAVRVACDPDPWMTGAWDSCRDYMTTDVTDLGVKMTVDNYNRLMQEVGLADYAEIMRGHVESGWRPAIVSREEAMLPEKARQALDDIVKPHRDALFKQMQQQQIPK